MLAWAVEQGHDWEAAAVSGSVAVLGPAAAPGGSSSGAGPGGGAQQQVDATYRLFASDARSAASFTVAVGDDSDQCPACVSYVLPTTLPLSLRTVPMLSHPFIVS